MGSKATDIPGRIYNRSMAGFDVVIIGGGIIGCSLARVLAGAGAKVAVAERGAPGEEASAAAAGMLSPSSEAEKGSPLFELCRASAKLYGPLAAELQADTGIDPQYRTEGTLLLFESEPEREQMLPSMEWQRSRGVPVEELSGQALREKEPALAALPGAFYLPDDRQIDNRLLMQALVKSCQQRGVTFLTGKSVQGIERNGQGVTGVVLANEKMAAEKVVNAAGAWAGAIQAPGLAAAPIRPVKGHMAVLQCPQPPLRHVVRSHRGYLVPRRDGRVLVGSTMEDAGFDKSVRAAPLTRLLSAAQELCPALQQSVLADCWAGLRPAAPDNLPLLGPASLPGYWLALGHFRNGILLAPITAEILSSLILTGKSPLPVEALLPQRLGE